LNVSNHKAIQLVRSEQDTLCPDQFIACTTSFP